MLKSRRWHVVSRILFVMLIGNLVIPMFGRADPWPSSAPSLAVPVSPVSPNDWQEDLSQRSEYRKVYRQGELVREILSITPLHQEVKPGEYAPIDNTLIPDRDQGFHNTNGPFRVNFSTQSLDHAFSFERGDSRVIFAYPEHLLGQAQSLNPTVSANHIQYQALDQRVRMAFEVGSGGLVQTIQLENAGSPHQVPVQMKVDGVTPISQSDGSIWFAPNNALTERAFYMPVPFVEDAAGARIGISTDLKSLDGENWMLIFSVDRAWLDAQDRSWPVGIQAYLLIDYDGGQWASLSSNDSPWSDQRWLEVTPGSYSPRKTAHMQFSFGSSPRPAGKQLQSATLNLTVPKSSCTRNCGATVQMAPENQEWFQRHATWSRPRWQGSSWSGGEARGTPRSLTFGDNYQDYGAYFTYFFNVTDEVRNWLNGSVPNYGFYLYNSSRSLNIIAPTAIARSDFGYYSYLDIVYADSGATSVVVNATTPTNPTVTVSGPASLVKTELLVDGVLAGSNANPSPGTFAFTIDTTKFPFGSHQMVGRTFTMSGQVVQSPVIVATFGDGVVTPPSNLTVHPLPGGEIQIAWGAATTNTPSRTITYTIERSNTESFTSPVTIATGNRATTYVDRSPGGALFYRVKAVTSAGVNSLFTPVSTVSPPISPFALRYRSLANGAIQLTWDASPTALEVSTSGLITYTLFRNGSIVASGIPGTSFIDTAVQPGTEYRYTVAAVNALNQTSLRSEELRTTARGSYNGPNAPENVRAQADRDTAVQLRWSPLSGTATTYDIVRYQGADPWVDPDTFSVIATGVTGSTWQDNGPLGEGQQYWYRIRAKQNGQVGPWSEPTGAVVTIAKRNGLDTRQSFVAALFGSNSAFVNLGTGNLVLSAVDASLPIPNLPMAVTRTFNSNDCEACTAMGYGWRLSSEWRVVPSSLGTVWVVEGDGTEHRFIWDGSQYQAESWYHGTLQRNAATGGWVLSLPSLVEYHFATDGKLQTVRERNGNELRYSYNSQGQLLSITGYPVSRSIQFRYDPSDRLASVTDSANRVTTYAYDSAGRLSRVINPAGEIVLYAYNHLNQLIRVQDGAGRWNQVVYGPNGAVTHLVDGLGNTTRISAAGTGDTRVTDPLGNATVYTINREGYLTAVTDPLGGITRFGYTFADHRLTGFTVTNPRGLLTNYAFDDAGRVTEVTESPGPNAETSDLVAPGVSSRTSTALYHPISGDLLSQEYVASASLARGQSNSYNYSGTGPTPFRLISITSQAFQRENGGQSAPVGGTATYLFDTELSRPGWVNRIIDPNGYRVDLAYNPDGTVQSVTRRNVDADLVAAGAATISRDLVQEFTYFADGQVREAFEWHRSDIPRSAATRFEYDSAGRRTRVIAPDGSSTYELVDPTGMPVITVDTGGGIWTRQYDNAYRLVMLTQPDGGTIRYAYDAAGNNTGITDPLGHTTLIRYDSLHRVVRTIDPNNMARGFAYDSVGNLTAESSGSVAKLDQNLGYTVRSSYYLSNLLRNTREPLPTSAIVAPVGVTPPPTEPGDPANTTYKITRYEYDRLGQVIRQIDGNGFQTSYTYDGLNRLLTVTQHRSAGNLTTRYGYDSNGNRTSVVDANGNTTSYRFDGLNRQWRQVSALNTAELDYRFDDAGNLTQKIEPRQIRQQSFTGITNYDYDNAHRLIGVRYTRTATSDHKSPDVTYAYDGAGRRLFMWDGFAVTLYRYDSMGRLLEERGANTSVSYSYDPASRLTAMTSSLGTTQYTYDNGNRLTVVQDPLGNRTTYAYDSNYGHLASLTLPLESPKTLTMQDTYYQLADGRVTPILKERAYRKSSSNTDFWKGTYTYDLVGMVRTFRDASLNQTYHYDEAYRLVQADGASNNNSHPNDRYVYDSVGNRTTWGNEMTSGRIYWFEGSTRWEISQTTNAANQVTKINEVASSSKKIEKTFQYEPNGNLIFEDWERTGFTSPCFQSMTNRVVYTDYYDAGLLARREEIDLTRLVNENNVTTTWYDGDGKRRSVRYQQFNMDYNCQLRPVINEVTVYEYANGDVLTERTAGDAPVWYVRDPSGNLLYTLHWRNGALKPDAYVRDRLGSIRFVLDYAGNTANTYKYDAYGQITQIQTLRNSYTFTGYGLDERAGLYHANARYYRPDLGRFLTQDTWKGSAWQPGTQNLYVYVGNNPINYVDPTGHAAQHVTVDDTAKTVILTWSILFSGDAATIQNAEAVVARIKQDWGGYYGGYQLLVDIQWAIKGDYSEGFVGDVMTLSTGSGISYVSSLGGTRGVVYLTDERGNAQDWQWVAAHEFGHYVGLADHYTSRLDPKTGRRTTSPEAGWQGNMMAVHLGTTDVRNVIELLVFNGQHGKLTGSYSTFYQSFTGGMSAQ